MWPECECKIHEGFNLAIKSVGVDVVEEVRRLQALFPTYDVKVTGHSLGAALAQVMTMYLLKNEVQVANMINFGQPRIGDRAYAAFSDKVFPDQWRVTHRKDIVPQTPAELQNYHHSSTEMYEDDSGIRQCDSSGEDPTCSDQWHAWQLNTSDHIVYLGMCIHLGCGNCNAWSTSFLV